MNQKETTKFVNFNTAFMAAQVLCFHFALLGYQFDFSGKLASGLQQVRVTIFHDKDDLIVPPVGYIFSESRTDHATANNYWTEFIFEY